MALGDKVLPRILVVDDDRVTREILSGVLEAEGFPVDSVDNGEAAWSLLKQQNYPIIVSDINMPQLDGLTLLSHLRASGSNAIVILITGFGSLEGAVEAMRQGAFDYLSKPVRPLELKKVMARAIRHFEAREGWKAPEVRSEGQLVPRTLIGRSPAMVQVYKMLAKASMSRSNVLITGESGTGKELVACAIHDNSSIRSGPFVTVNCGALAENLLESELFGHVKGAFTGAVAAKRGLFEEADGGTIFLDEIGDISLSLQVKLLRVIQEGEFKPVGSNEIKRVEARVISATHRDLSELLREGKFREDLYYRLKVILIELPPLRNRVDDLQVLVTHFLRRFSIKTGKEVTHVSPDAMTKLMSYRWPGNIRELEHTLERAVAMTNTTTIYPEDFPEVDSEEMPLGDPEAEEDRPLSRFPSLRSATSLEEMERQHILKVLFEVGFNKSRAADVLGIDRATLYRKAQRYAIELSVPKSRS